MARKPEKPPQGLDLLPSGKYRARVYHEGRQQSIGAFHTLGDAKAALAIARSELARGTFVPPAQRRAEAKRAKETGRRTAVTVDDLAQDWFAWLERVGRAQGTIYTYESRYRQHIAPAFGSRPVVDVAPQSVDDWHADLLDRRGHGVARSAYLTMSALFSYAAGKSRGQSRSFTPLITESPVHTPGATTHKRVRAGEGVVASPPAVRSIAARMRPEHRLAALLSGVIALRIGEVLALRRGDVSQDRAGHWWLCVDKQVQARGAGLYESEPKSAAGKRDLPVPPELVDDLNAHMREHVARKRSSLLFARPGQPEAHVHPNSLRSDFNAAVSLHNDAQDDHEGRLEDFTYHGLRHSALTRIGQAGATIAELQAFAGHSDASVVAKYQHATRDRLTMLAGALSRDNT